MMRIVATVALVLVLHFPALAESFQGRGKDLGEIVTDF